MIDENTIKEDNKTTVVHVISEYKVAVNKNLVKDIQVGDRFNIYELTEEILDPISKESLGRLKIYKGSGKVEDVQETMAILRSDRESLQLTSAVSAVSAALTGQKPLMPFNNPKYGDMAERIGTEK